MLKRETAPFLEWVELLSLGLRRLTNPRVWAYGLFWSWNAMFLAFMLLGFGPQVLPMMLVAVQMGDIPPVFLGYASALTLVPVAVVLMGILFLRRSPARLFALGYGIEGPLMLLLMVRFFLVGEATLGVALLLAIVGLGLATFLWHLLDQAGDRRGVLLLSLRGAGLTLLLLAGFYASLWLTFYAIPAPVLVAEVLGQVGRDAQRFLREFWLALAGFDWRAFLELPWRWVPFWVLGVLLLSFTGVLLAAMPVAVMVLYVRAWRQSVRTLVQHIGRQRAVSLVAGVALICVVSVVVTNRQPQQRAFALLATPPTSAAEAGALLERQEEIRAGLLNAYLARFRYVGAVGEVTHVSRLYEQAFGMPWERARPIQRLYEMLYRPLLYAPVHPVARTDNVQRPWSESALRQEPVEAAKLYERFFDGSIVDGERDTVIQAVRSTWSADRAQAALQVVDDRVVHLERQEVSVVEYGDWAEIELYEVYQNRTRERQEVVYYFSLPESAVITGLWLGNSPQRAEAFVHRVAPRGAAQAVYRNEVLVRNMDPALVEQLGPTQYRLRIYPVEPRRWLDGGTWNRPVVEEGQPLHLWMTWQVLARDGEWPLPRLADKRNIYWDEASVRLVNGQPMAANRESWLPAAVPATSPVQPVPHRVRFPSGEIVIARPLSEVDLPSLPADLRLAVVLDRSRSMAGREAEVTVALDRITAVSGGGNVDVYLTASPYRGEAPARMGLARIVPETLLYYGGQNAAELLVQFDQLRGDEAYDGILVLTDGTGYELSADGIQVPIPNDPVWMVHLGGDFPVGYDDGTLQAIQASGGGSVGSVDEALRRLAVGLNGAQTGASRVVEDVVDGYLWTAAAPGDAVDDAAAADERFAPLAARRLILAEMQRQRGALDLLETLDHLHDIAIEQSIVTPYSSMIVLVDTRQKRLLDQLEQRDDRFVREYEGVGETAEADALAVTAVPEPEEWLLLGLVATMLGWYVYQRRHRLFHHRAGEA